MTVIHNKNERLAFLDSLRGLAALYVILYHMSLMPKPHLGLPSYAASFVLFGGSGVTLFFIVSAFSLCLTMPRRPDGRPDLLIFYTRRLFRIAPFFFFMVLVTLFRDYHVFHVSHSAEEILASLSFLFNFFPKHVESFVWASWTISVEMLFYMLFPFLYRVHESATKIIYTFLSFLFLALIFKEIVFASGLPAALQGSYYNFSVFHNLPIFICGIFGFYVVSQPTRFHLTRPVGACLVLGSIYGFYSLLHDGLRIVFPDAYYWQGVLYLMLLVGVSAWPTKILVNRFTRYMGKISYSLYLNHPNVVFFLIPFYKLIYAHSWSDTVKFAASAGVTVACVIAVSIVTFYLIEQPGVNLGRYLSKRLRQRPLNVNTGTTGPVSAHAFQAGNEKAPPRDIDNPS